MTEIFYFNPGNHTHNWDPKPEAGHAMYRCPCGQWGWKNKLGRIETKPEPPDYSITPPDDYDYSGLQNYGFEDPIESTDDYSEDSFPD
jgi:hypothetical protein